MQQLRTFVAGGVDSQNLDGLKRICGDDLSTCSNAIYDLANKAYYLMSKIGNLEYSVSSSVGDSTEKHLAITGSM